METEFITPAEAVHRLMAQHYPGKKRGNARRARMALIGALRTEHVEWRCGRWKEIFTAESGATYTEGEITDCPKHGWPADFWQPALAVDNDAWQGNFFISYGTVTMHSAPYKVRLWMASNDDVIADWSRVAESVELNWHDANKLLKGPGWQVWEKPGERRESDLKVSRYEDALIEMIAAALSEPSTFANQRAIFERLEQAFDTYGSVPDEKTIGRIARNIWRIVEPCAADDAP